MYQSLTPNGANPLFAGRGLILPLSPIPRWFLESLAAADELSAKGVEAEVIDIRTLNPLDDETIFASVAKTGRAIVVTEAVLTGGFAAELSARISERCFDYLEEPVLRVAGEDIPIPVSPAWSVAPFQPRSSSLKRPCGFVKRIAPSWAT